MRKSTAAGNRSVGKTCQSHSGPLPGDVTRHRAPDSHDISTEVRSARCELIRVDERRRFRARILLVENDASIREFHRESLTAAGFNVTVANNRPAGLAALDQAPGIELIICGYKLGNEDPLGGIILTDQLQSMWTDSRSDRLPSVLLLGRHDRLEQELLAEEHGAYFSPQIQKIEIFRKSDLILLKRRRLEYQQVFLVEHSGRMPASTYCTDTELISAVYTAHRTRRRTLPCALRERLTLDMLARHTNRWLSLKDLTDLLQNSDFHFRHGHRDWRFSPKSLKESLHLLRGGIDEVATALHADFRADQLVLTRESGRYERLYKLNCAVGWLHP